MTEAKILYIEPLIAINETEELENQAIEAWSKVNSFDDILKLNIEYIRDSKTYTPFYSAKFNSDDPYNPHITPELRKRLINVNEAGLWTMESQETDVKLKWRNWLNGICTTANAKKLTNSLNKIDGIYSYYVRPSNALEPIWNTEGGVHLGTGASIQLVKDQTPHIYEMLMEEDEYAEITIIDTIVGRSVIYEYIIKILES
jgi:hypothetical protein